MYRGRIPVAFTQSVTNTPAAITHTGSGVSFVLQADPDNTQDIRIGDASNQYLVLEAGQSITLQMDIISRLYVVADSDTQVLNGLSIS